MRMSRSPAWALLAVVIPHASLFGGDPKPNLLPTGPNKKQILAIRSRLVTYHDGAPGRRDFNRLKAIVTGFVMAQLEAEPRLDADQLRKQLIRLSLTGTEDRPPFVVRKPLDPFSLPPGPATRGVAYEEPLYAGWGGNHIVVESYIVDLQGPPGWTR